jgi:hypothetical protein
VWPLISFQRSSVLTGSAAEPDTIKRNLVHASLRVARRSGGAASQAAMSFT